MECAGWCSRLVLRQKQRDAEVCGQLGKNRGERLDATSGRSNGDEIESGGGTKGNSLHSKAYSSICTQAYQRVTDAGVPVQAYGSEVLETKNGILSGLPRSVLRRLAPSLKAVELGLKQLLFAVDTPIEHVYFIEKGVASLITVMGDGSAVEAATVGPEGMVGLPLLLGTRKTASQAIMQVPGSALKMRARDFKAEVARGGLFLDRLLRYTQALFALVAQSSACNRRHKSEQRCARWLLLTHDRVRGDVFFLTQQFLSQMLGLRRATVTGVAAALARKGVIRYHRGKMTISDRAGLEKASCECYALIRGEFDRLLRGKRSSVAVGAIRRVSSHRGVSTVKGGGQARRRRPRR